MKHIEPCTAGRRSDPCLQYFNFNEDTCPNPLGRHHRLGFKNCVCAVSDGPNKMNSVKIKNQRVFTLYNVLSVYIVVGG